MVRLFYVFALVVAGAAPSARADPDAHAQALHLFGESDKAYKAGQFERAAELLRKAHGLYPEPILMYNLGRALEGVGDAKGAVAAYEAYLHDGKHIDDRAAIERRVATLKAQLAKQEQEDAARRQQQQQEADARKQALSDEAGRQPQDPAGVARKQPTDTASHTQDQPQRHDQGPAIVDHDHESRLRELAPWATLGAGAALVITGGLFGLRASSNHRDAVSSQVQVDAQRLQNSATTDATVANVLFGVGGAVAIGGAIWAYLDWRSGGASHDASAHLTVTRSRIAVEWAFP